MADFRLPISNTSTHKSVSPATLTFTNTENGTVTYDGSAAKTINLQSLAVSTAATLGSSAQFTANLAGAQATAYNGSQSAVNVAISGQLKVGNGGTGLSTITADAIMLGNGTSNVKLLAKSSTKGQVVGIDSSGNVAYQSITLTSSGNTTAGEALTLKVGNTQVGQITLDSASATQSGVVTTTTQTFTGAKTFTGGIHSQLFCVENTSNQHKVQLVYNDTTESLDFNFV